jgi:nickel-type superoxide dismutase maturation protease
MAPLLSPQQEVLIDPAAFRQHMPVPGDLVVAQHPHRPDLRLIKWVVYVEHDRCFLKGLNPAASTDSRDFGLVAKEQLVGRVLCRLP